MFPNAKRAENLFLRFVAILAATLMVACAGETSDVQNQTGDADGDSTVEQDISSRRTPDNTPTYLIEFDTVRRSGTDPDYEVHLAIPRLVVPRRSALENAFNAGVRDSIIAEMENFLSHLEPWQGDIEPPGNTSYELESIVRLRRRTLLNIGLYYYMFVQGAAHPSHQAASVTFDLESGKFLSLGDLFKEKSDYLTVISNYAVKKLNALEYTDAEWVRTGAGPDSANFSTFFLSSDTLTIYFNEYQVAPYAAGPQQVGIPLTVLRSRLRQDIIEALGKN